MSGFQNEQGKRRFFEAVRTRQLGFSNERGRYWVFVKHNPSSEDLPKNFKDAENCFWQIEKGEKGGSIHMQGVVKFLYPKSYAQVREILPSAWWSNMKGTHEQAIAYCTKDETRVSGPFRHFHVVTEGNLALRKLRPGGASVASAPGQPPAK